MHQRIPLPFGLLSMPKWILGLVVLSILVCRGNAQQSQPNILWITCEDTGPQLGCYGDSYATTPNLDLFASRSLKFNSCWSNAPVCAPARTTLIAGLYPTSYGAQHMRSSIPLPPGADPLPSILRKAGYYCSNNSKEDYNFPKPKGMWDESSNKAHWKNRKPGQPFFAVFNTTVTHESQIRKRPYLPKHDPTLAPIPPYHPDDPEVRLDWAQYYDRITEMDDFVGQKLKEIKQAGLEDSTIVFFFGDHGCGLPRGKRWLYQSGLHVPMIVHIPKTYSKQLEPLYHEGASTNRLVAFVDLLPTVLDLCGLPIPKGLHGRSFFTAEPNANQFLYGFRDRMDERIDSSRSIRNDRFLYIRNFMPDRPQGSYLNYMFQTPTTQVWKKRFDSNDLSDSQKLFWLHKPIEELYDIQNDPHQIQNLADDPKVQLIKKQLANALKSKMIELEDTGAIPEDWIGKNRHNSTVAVESAWRSGQAHMDTEVLLSMLNNAEVIQRYWGAVAMRAGSRSTEDERVWEMAKVLLNDPSLEIRAVVAESLIRYSKQEQWKAKALEVLLEIPLQKQTPWGARMIALNALCDLGVSDQQALQLNQAFETDGKTWSAELPDRYSEYLSRQILRLRETSRQ